MHIIHAPYGVGWGDSALPIQHSPTSDPVSSLAFKMLYDSAHCWETWQAAASPPLYDPSGIVEVFPPSPPLMFTLKSVAEDQHVEITSLSPEAAFHSTSSQSESKIELPTFSPSFQAPLQPEESAEASEPPSFSAGKRDIRHQNLSSTLKRCISISNENARRFNSLIPINSTSIPSCSKAFIAHCCQVCGVSVTTVWHRLKDGLYLCHQHGRIHKKKLKQIGEGKYAISKEEYISRYASLSEPTEVFSDEQIRVRFLQLNRKMSLKQVHVCHICGITDSKVWHKLSTNLYLCNTHGSLRDRKIRQIKQGKYEITKEEFIDRCIRLSSPTEPFSDQEIAMRLAQIHKKMFLITIKNLTKSIVMNP